MDAISSTLGGQTSNVIGVQGCEAGFMSPEGFLSFLQKVSLFLLGMSCSGMRFHPMGFLMGRRAARVSGKGGELLS